MTKPQSPETVAQMLVAPLPIAATEGRGVVSRVTHPAPQMVNLEKHRPIIRVSTNSAAGADITLCRPLGYAVRSVNLLAPGWPFKSTSNTDSLYVDVEDSPLAGTGTPANPQGVELPAGSWMTIEETDPGWIHWTSPTANQRLMWWCGGPSH